MNILKITFTYLLMLSLTNSVLFANKNTLSGEEKAAKFMLIKNALRSKISADTIAKSYLYLGQKIGTRQASKEKTRGIKMFKSNFEPLEQSINDPKIKNLVSYIRFSYDEMIELVNLPYSLDNAQVILDLSTSIGEGSQKIADKFRDEIGRDPIVFDGLVPDVETIAKYYIAYTGGIKDENTVSLMKEAVEGVAKGLKRRAEYPKNTVEMNKAINKAIKLWDIVYQFYLDIDDNGLPFIVLKTTTDLKKGITKYNKAYVKRRRAELKASK